MTTIIIQDEILEKRKAILTLMKVHYNLSKSSNYRSHRDQLINDYGTKCLCCKEEKKLTIDHILPQAYFPELTNVYSNLQLLCVDCNREKGTDTIDYRPNKTTSAPTELELKKFFITYILKNNNKKKPSLEEMYKKRKILRNRMTNIKNSGNNKNINKVRIQLTKLNKDIKLRLKVKG